MPAKNLADGVLVVNLDERNDRWESFQRDIAPHLSPMAATRLSAVKGVALKSYGKAPWFHGGKRDKTWAGRAGCTLSHRAAITRAVAEGWHSLLILEDDVAVTPGFVQLRDALAQQLAQVQWDICYLGFTDPVGPFKKIATLDASHSLYRIYGCNTTHAYLVNESAYGFLLAQLPEESTVWSWLSRHRAIDRWYARAMSRKLVVLAVSPSILNQSDSVSDITGRQAEAAHVTSVSASSAAPNYSMALWLRRFFFAMTGSYDTARGFFRSITGF